jgi:hypothetical protein
MMTQSAQASTRQAVALLGPVTILALPYALSETFSRIPWWDDEGTLLIGIRAFVAGHRMYDEVYSLYGPLYNLVYGFIYGPLGVPATHDEGRLIAALFWLVWTAAFSLFCFYLSRSIAGALVSFVVLLIWLRPLMESPGHPQELCLVLIGASLLLTLLLEPAADGEKRKGVALFCLGAAVAALSLIKINVGVFFGLPLLVVFLRQSWSTILASYLAPLAAIGLVLLPLAVQAILFDLPWVRAYSAFSVLSIAAACLVYFRTPRSPFVSAWAWIAILAGGGLTSLLIVGAMMAAGSSLHGILNGVLLQNMYFARNWYIPLHVGGRGLLAASLSLVAAGAYCLVITRPEHGRRLNLAVAALKSLFVAAGLWFFLRHNRLDMLRLLVPFCWLLLAPPETAANPYRIARSAAALIGVTMSLYAFPVAGEQIEIAGAFPPVILVVLAHDVASTLRAQWPDRYVPMWSWLPVGASAIAIALGTVVTVNSVWTYYRGAELGLPGTAFIRTDDRQQVEDLQWVTHQLSSCHASYSLPGLDSFYLWTGQSPPTMLNINAQLNFLNSSQQQSVVDALSREEDLCVVYSPALLQRFDRGQAATNPPILKFVSTALTSSSERDGYIILRRRSASRHG